ncbi:MAG: hypothetical protein ACI9MR_004243 [Myxococcota bacterium]|jgi:hypothetical protein
MLALLLLGVSAEACRKPRKRAYTKQQQQKVAEAVLETAPKPQTPADITLNDTIRYLGVDFDRSAVRPGGKLTATWYWEALKPAQGGWKVFVHFYGPHNKRTVHDHHTVGELHPISSWKAGQIIADVQEIKVPADWPDGEARFDIGIFDEIALRDRKANERMKPTKTGPAAPKVRAHPDGRIEAARITISKTAKGAAAAVTPTIRPRAYTAFTAGGTIVIDGKVDDAGWRGVAPTRAFVQPGGKNLRPGQRTQARVTWDAVNLYVAFTCPDKDIYNDQTGRDATLWKQDVVEIYLDPGNDGKDYVELQVSPMGEIFDAHFSSRRKPAWPEAAKRLTLAGMLAGVDVVGSVNDRKSTVKDARWTAEIAVPWGELPGVEGPPKAGETWGMNLYRIDQGGKGWPGFMGAWAPAGGDFHNVAEFGTVTFSAQTPKVHTPRPKIPAAPGKLGDPANSDKGLEATDPKINPAARPTLMKPTLKPKPATIVPAGTVLPKGLPIETPTPTLRRMIPAPSPKPTSSPAPAVAPKEGGAP